MTTTATLKTYPPQHFKDSSSDVSAMNSVTGITPDGLIDIVIGELAIGTERIDVPVKIEYKRGDPYWYYGKKRRVETSHKDIARSWFNEGRKVNYVPHKYSTEISYQVPGSDEPYHWLTVGCDTLYLPREIGDAIKEKIYCLEQIKALGF